MYWEDEIQKMTKINDLLKIFELPKSDLKSTEKFSEISHDDLCNTFDNWFVFASRREGWNVNSVEIHGLHDRGIDLIFGLAKGEGDECKIGIQVKSDRDIKKGLEAQVSTTLANWGQFNVDFLIIIFCGDLTNKSQKIKVRQQVSRIQQNKANNILTLEPRKAVTIFNYSSPLQALMKQFEVLKRTNTTINFNVTGHDIHDSGFVIIHVSYRAKNIANYWPPSIIKAYLLIVMGFLVPETLLMGYFSESRIVHGFEGFGSLTKIIINDDPSYIEIPFWFIRGLERHGPVNLWGSTAGEDAPGKFSMFIQFLITQRKLEDGKHYKFVQDKFEFIAERLEQAGEFEL